MRQWFLSWVSRLLGLGEARASDKRRPPRARTTLIFEQLEDRAVPSTFLVRNINPTGDSNPGRFAEVNGTLFFVANDGSHGRELWKSDGTSTGTVLVKDIRPGTGDSDPNWLTNVNGTLFFSANNGTNGRELWKSDGTSAGTVLVKDIYPGAADSYPIQLTNVNGTLFFSALDTTHYLELNVELWKSNGTSTGTVMVMDIRPGPIGSYPSWLTNVNGTLFFGANDGLHGYELWKSNGTSTGTVLVRDVFLGTPSSRPHFLTNVNGTLFFTAIDGSNGRELRKSDGTSTGTVLVRDIRSGTASSLLDFAGLTNVNGTLFFSANDGSHGSELWKSDGTSAGTALVRDIRPGTDGSLGGDFPHPDQLTNVNGTLFFVANDGSNGFELWRSDGTSTGTVLVRDIRPGTAHSDPDWLTNVNGTLFFVTYRDSIGRELWKSDGTYTGTVLVRDIRIGMDGSSPDLLTNVNGTLFFRADDGTNGRELWATDDWAPAIVSVTPPANGTYRAGQVLDVLVRFSEPVNVGTTSTAKPYIQLRIGSVIRQALFLNQPNPTTLRFRYVVQTGDLDTDGIEILSPVMRPSGTYIRDLAGNDALVTFTPPSTTGVTVNGVTVN